MKNDADNSNDKSFGLLFVIFIITSLILLILLVNAPQASAQAITGRLCGYNGNDCLPYALSISQDRTKLVASYSASQQGMLYVTAENGYCGQYNLSTTSAQTLVSNVINCADGYITATFYTDKFGTGLGNFQFYNSSDNKLYYVDELTFLNKTVSTTSPQVWSQDSGDVVFGLAIIIFLLALMGMSLVFPKFKF